MKRVARLRPTEVKAVAALLDEPAEDVDDLARSVVRRVNELRADREDWVIVVVDPGVCVHVHGPYETKAAALKDKTVFAASAGAKGLVVPLINGWEDGDVLL